MVDNFKCLVYTAHVVDRIRRPLLGLKHARAAKRMTQEMLGTAMGVDAETVSRWERGTRSPDTETLYRLADALGCQPGDIVNVADADQEAQADG
jgi:transcriptional regulator with XRE-family HTH domain